MALTLKTDPEKLILENVCSIKNYDCCNDDCGKCCNFRNVEDILIVLEGVSEAKYGRWVCRGKHYQKDEVADSGDDVIVMLKQILTKSFKMHVYNISCQYSELKHLKANLKEDEIILSVDFSKNYDNKQHHEIQNACSGHEAFTLYTAACYHRSHNTDGACVDKDAGLKVLSFAIVSKEIIHEQNLVFSCDMKLLEIVRQHIPNLKKVFFWSDGCTAQFHSRFAFPSMNFYPNDLELSWDYGEAHHFKGPHDGIGRTVKEKFIKMLLHLRLS